MRVKKTRVRLTRLNPPVIVTLAALANSLPAGSSQFATHFSKSTSYYRLYKAYASLETANLEAERAVTVKSNQQEGNTIVSYFFGK